MVSDKIGFIVILSGTMLVQLLRGQTTEMVTDAARGEGAYRL